MQKSRRKYFFFSFLLGSCLYFLSYSDVFARTLHPLSQNLYTAIDTKVQQTSITRSEYEHKLHTLYQLILYKKSPQSHLLQHIIQDILLLREQHHSTTTVNISKEDQPEDTTKKTSSTPTKSSDTTIPTRSQEMLAILNTQRNEHNLTPVRIDETLSSIAQAHAQDMANKGYFSHSSKDGKTPFERMTSAGYKYSYAGENIAQGQQTVTQVMSSRIESPGHRQNILNQHFTEVGFGRYQDHRVQVFAKPQ